MAGASVYVDEARAYPQGELFFMQGEPGQLTGLVYNTTGLNKCPPSRFSAIDVNALRAETQSSLVWKNPRRFWTMDHLTAELAGDAAEFHGLAFNCVARMQMPATFDPAKGQAGTAYRPAQIGRTTRYEYLSGKPVFLLRSPDGMTWVMQTYTNHVDAHLGQALLPTLGQRLALPAGWEFRAKVLDRDLVLDTKGLAHIVPDDLENMYQGCTEDVRNFDPWDAG
jgi:hypothetical protein